MHTQSISRVRYYLAIAGFAILAVLSAVVVRSVARADIASSTPPIISAIVASTTNTTATISWTTNQGASSQVAYGADTSYGTNSILDTALFTSHVIVLSGLTPNTTYHFQVLSANGSSTLATSSDQTFMTMMTASTSTATTTPEENDNDQGLQDQINNLSGRVTTLEQKIQDLKNGEQGENENGGGGTGTTTTPQGNPTISPNNFQVRSGTTVDFTGHNWGFREPVKVSRGGTTIRTALADDGGNFSTGSITVGTTLGTETYTFHGVNTGTTLTQDIQIIP